MKGVRKGKRPVIKYPTDRFAARLNKLRVEAQLSEAEMCEWLGGVARATLGAWSRGTRSPQWYTGDRCMKALDYLETEIARKEPRLPPPIRVRQDDRLAYVRKVRSAYPPV